MAKTKTKTDKQGRVWLPGGIFKREHKCKPGVFMFYIRYTKPDGKRRVEAAGTSLQQAQRLQKQRMGELATGEYVDPRDVVDEAGPTVEEFSKTFLKDHPGSRRSHHYQGTLRPIVAQLGPRHLREITRADLDQLRVHLLAAPAVRRGGRPLSPTTVAKVLRTVVRLFRMAVRWGVLEVNPAADLEKPAAAKHKTRWLSREEWETAKAAAPPGLLPLMRLAVATGMRLGEVVSARWDDVDVPGKLLHVAGETKTGTRAVPLGAEALDVLADLLARRQGSLVLRRSPFVFVDSAGADYTSMEARNRISKATKAVLKKAGVTGASYHTLRHTAASFMVQAGTSLYDVQVILGHSTPAMTQRYAHLAPDHLRGAVAALDRALGHVATPVATQDAAETASASSTASAAG